MEKLITRKEAAKILGISLTTLDEARNSGLISYIQYVPNGCVYFTFPSFRPSWFVKKSTERTNKRKSNISQCAKIKNRTFDEIGAF